MGVAVAGERLAVAVEAGPAAVAWAVVAVTGMGLTEATAVVGVDAPLVMFGDAVDGESAGAVALATALGADLDGVVIPIGVEGAVANAWVGANTVGIACPETLRPVRVPRSATVTTKGGTTNRRTACLMRWQIGAPPFAISR